MLLLAAALAFALAPTSSAALAGPPRVQLSVSPARLALSGASARTLRLRNAGSERVVVDVTRRTADGRTAARTWLGVVPTRLSLRAGATAMLTVRVTPPRGAAPGDHRVLVLLTTRPTQRRRQRAGTARRAGQDPRTGVRAAADRRSHAPRPTPRRVVLVPIANRGTVSIPLRGKVNDCISPVTDGVLHGFAVLCHAHCGPGGRTMLALLLPRGLHGPVPHRSRPHQGRSRQHRRAALPAATVRRNSLGKRDELFQERAGRRRVEPVVDVRRAARRVARDRRAGDDARLGPAGPRKFGPPESP